MVMVTEACPNISERTLQNRAGKPRLQSGDAWLVNSPRQAALLLGEFQLSPWGILAWGYDP
jgi:hypothetical protein